MAVRHPGIRTTPKILNGLASIETHHSDPRNIQIGARLEIILLLYMYPDLQKDGLTREQFDDWASFMSPDELMACHAMTNDDLDLSIRGLVAQFTAPEEQ